MLNKFTIKLKLVILSFIVSSGFIAIVVLGNLDLGELSKLSQMKDNVNELNIGELSLRKHEKNFLARKKMKYSNKFLLSIKKINKNSEKLMLMMNDFHLDNKSLMKYRTSIKIYKKAFAQLVQIQQEIGLGKKKGLYGKLRVAVQKVQSFAQDSRDYRLLAFVYDLRKQEKDFLLRKDMKYSHNFNEVMKELNLNITNKQMLKLLKTYTLTFNKLVSLEKIKGFNKDAGLLGKMGIAIHKSDDLLAHLKEQINNEIAVKTRNIKIFSILFVLVIAVFVTLTLLYISRSINLSLKSFEKGLIQFFAFINNESKVVEMLEEKNEDEIGKMSKIINQNIIKTQLNIEKDRTLIDDVTVVANNIKKGHLEDRITKKANSKELNELKNVINEMLKNLNQNISNVLNILDSYTNYNYLPRVSTLNIEGEILELCKGINFLGDSSVKMLKNNKEIGQELIDSAKILVNNVGDLNSNANATAASIEETAAALEEITSTVISNNENIEQLSSYAQEVTESIQKGEKLASETSQSMDDLNSQVSSINDAIGLIDKISFQTNILSLNAAVEAATAGEAGKGFAVVAQEVRNLAARSAEAANEIKTLVENATTKASEGKQIAKKMIMGYSSLKENIENTISVISDVSISSKEQKRGIEQINDAVTQVDQQTQKIALVAGETKTIAEQTNAIANDIVEDTNKKIFETEKQ